MSLTKVLPHEEMPPVGLMELLQTPVTRRQTGVLVVSGPDDEVRLFYARGELVHAHSAACTGIDALVQVLGWPSGDAEFVGGAVCDQRTIHVDVPRALVMALRMLDSRARSATSHTPKETQPARAPASAPKPAKRDAVSGPRSGRARQAQASRARTSTLDVELCVQLAEYVVGSGFARYACVLRNDGGVQAEAGMETAVEGVPALRSAMSLLISGHSRPGLDHVVIEDRLGTIVLASLGGERALMVVGDRHPQLANVVDGVSRLVATLAQHQQ